jgi:prepilin-type N-terminal cleavage/methylation domain-containing protein
MFTPKTPRQTAGFTLVELLTVIAIIAILMGILLPTVGSVIENAKKTQAKNDELQLVSAIKAYYTEYGRYPIDPSTPAGDLIYGPGNGDQSVLMNVLRYPYKSTDTGLPAIVTTLNPRKINFLEVKDAKNLSKAGKEKEGIGGIAGSTQGKWLDPWGNEYLVKIDGDYDNSLSNPYSSNAGSSSLSLGVIIWTKGRDGATTSNMTASGSGSGDKNAGTSKDDVVSWQ